MSFTDAGRRLSGSLGPLRLSGNLGRRRTVRNGEGPSHTDRAMHPSKPTVQLLVLGSCVLLAACGEDSIVGSRDESLDIECSIPVSDVFRGATRGAIPALTNPDFVSPDAREAEYLAPDDRVVGLYIDGEPVAIPLNIFWWHEIVNLDTADGPIAVTHCPLTGSTLAFSRGTVDGAEFEVSGLLYENNLMMADRSGDAESLWPQMARGARCGPRDGDALEMLPVTEMTWEAWRELHPASPVSSQLTGFSRDYTEYPYGDYADTHNADVLFPSSEIDERRPPKERALGVPDGSGGVVVPFGELDEGGRTHAAHGSTSDGDFVVFWDRDAQAAVAYRSVVDGDPLTFRGAFGSFFDDQTDSEWSLEGVATNGPLEGQTLEPVAEAFVAFWFAWPVFYPDLEIWTGA